MSNDKPAKPDGTKRKSAGKPAKHQLVDQELLDDEAGENRFLLFNVMPSWLVSFIGHVVLILLMAFLIMPSIEEESVTFQASEVATESLDSIDLDLDTELEVSEDVLETEITEEVVEIVEEVAPEIDVEVPLEDFAEVDLTSEIFDASASFTESFEVGATNEVQSRTSESKARLLREYGGSNESEEAVALALKWIVDHQLSDGGWNFDHRIGGGDTDRSSPDPGELVEARAGATAMALLPLLGNGQTHLTGKYKDVVRRGLEYLMARGTPQRRGAVSFLEPGGTMYSHGLAAIVFAEAFAMTEDPLLAPFAQGSIWFIEQAQDPVGGGWRYKMNQAGDTSAVGWQVMAIKSAKLSGIQINKRTYKLIDKFLNAISIENGSIYGYDAPPARVNRGRRAVTAIGLLCRMYMGWEKDRPGLQEGVRWLSDEVGPDVGPDKSSVNMYYNYYGTQVMKQYGGQQWKKWNAKMRDYLVATQDKSGAAKGSWMFNRLNHSSEKGGRLYCTSMACMTLEVYYRYLPLYSQKATEDDFPLD
jgi:hypothetical protein